MKNDAVFLQKVRELAVDNNMNATAKKLNIPTYKMKARLLSATMALGEVPPRFAKMRVMKKKKKKAIQRNNFADTVRVAGKSGSAVRVIIPQSIFEDLGWNAGDNILVKRSGKNKIIIEKTA